MDRGESRLDDASREDLLGPDALAEDAEGAGPTGSRSGRPRAGASLTGRAVNAGVWTFLFRIAARLVGLVRNVALARILVPDDIGLFGIVLVILSVLERFTEPGLHSALIQKGRDIADDLDSTWTVLVLRRTALSAILVFGAPLAAGFFEEPRAVPLIRLLGLAVFIQSFANIGVLYFRRELESRWQYLHTFSGTLADLVVSITLAFFMRNAWALMFGLLASRVVSVAVSYLVHPYRPRLRLDWARTRELNRFGRWVFADNVVAFLAYRGDNLIVGKVLGPAALGVYMLAYSVSEVVTVEVSRIVNNVAFPAYARKQGDRERVSQAFLTATELVAAVSLPVAVAMAVLARPLTLVMLGANWLEVAAVLPPLAFAGCIRAIVVNGNAVSKGLGHPQYALRMNVFGILVMYAVLIPLGLRYGIVGIGVAVLCGAIAKLPLFVAQTTAVLGAGVRPIARALAPAVAMSAGTLASLAAASRLLAHHPPLVSLLVSGVVAAAANLLVAAVLWYTWGAGPLRVALFILGHRRRPRIGAAPQAAA
jgi:lipopolysaccharide exporter